MIGATPWADAIRGRDIIMGAALDVMRDEELEEVLLYLKSECASYDEPGRWGPDGAQDPIAQTLWSIIEKLARRAHRCARQLRALQGGPALTVKDQSVQVPWATSGAAGRFTTVRWINLDPRRGGSHPFASVGGLPGSHIRIAVEAELAWYAQAGREMTFIQQVMPLVERALGQPLMWTARLGGLGAYIDFARVDRNGDAARFDREVALQVWCRCARQVANQRAVQKADS